MLIDIIKKRRSIRNFLDKPVEREKILRCLEAARLAPSACNTQPWKFIIVDNKDLKDELCGQAFSGIYSMCSFVKSAPVVVAIVSEKQKFITKVGSLIRGTQFYLIDIGITGEHFVLQAAELGLGTCWIGWFDEKKVKKILGIHYSSKIDTLIALGYYQETYSGAGQNRKPLEEIVSWNKKQQK